MKKLKPYHVTDNTVEMKAVFGLTSSTKRKKTKHKTINKMNSEQDYYLYTITSDKIFSVFPWLLNEID